MLYFMRTEIIMGQYQCKLLRTNEFLWTINMENKGKLGKYKIKKTHSIAVTMMIKLNKIFI